MERWRVRRWLLWLPLALLLVVLAFAARELMKPSDRTVYSAMVGQPVPDFDLPSLVPGKPGLSAAALRSGQEISASPDQPSKPLLTQRQGRLEGLLKFRPSGISSA